MVFIFHFIFFFLYISFGLFGYTYSLSSGCTVGHAAFIGNFLGINFLM